ncbi:MAG: uroporphyrinogen decarboxylase, partial [Planctomycetes bacterium]|nr:uroporphyrinogen decarboxylase [Planctomycetota bacterium]
PKRFGVDAIIFFQDILTPLAPMGAPFVFRPGPVLEKPIRSASDIAALKRFDPSRELRFVYDIIRSVRSSLAGELPLLGFAGAPLTLAFFLIAGRSPGLDPAAARALMTSDAGTFHRLLDLLAEVTIDYLQYQIDAGADAVQLFESTADLLSPEEYAEFAHPYQVKVLSALAGRVPAILFAKDQPNVDLMVESGADVLSISAIANLAEAKQQYGNRVAFQGNVDNRLLAEGTLDQIDEAVLTCLTAGGHQGHILNLGHGLLANTPVEHVQRLIELSRMVRPSPESIESAAEYQTHDAE